MMKRMMSLLLCVMLLASSCLPAYAKIQTDTEQIHFAGETVKADEVISGELKLNAEFSKTLTEAEGENNFNLELKVRTNQDVTKTQNMADAAVVLVFDLSGSMGYSETAVRDEYKNKKEIKNPVTGEIRTTHEFDSQNPDYGINDRDDNKDGVVTYPQLPSSLDYDPDGKSDRLEKAKYAAFQFLEKFAKVTNGDTNAKREVAIVVFDIHARVIPVKDSNWTDIASTTDELSASYRDVEEAIIRLIHEGSTNTEGGMQVAYNLYENENLNEAVRDIKNRNIILMTDGVPLEYMPNNVYGLNSDQNNDGAIDIKDQAAYFAKMSLDGVTVPEGTNGKSAAFALTPTYIRNTGYGHDTDAANKNYRDTGRDQYSDWGPEYDDSEEFGNQNGVPYRERVNGSVVEYNDPYERFPYMRRVVPFHSANEISDMGRHIRDSNISLYGIPIDMPYLYVHQNDSMAEKEYADQLKTLSRKIVRNTSSTTTATTQEIKDTDGKDTGEHYAFPDTPAKQKARIEGKDSLGKPNYIIYEEANGGSAGWFKTWCTDSFVVTSENASSWADAFNRIFALIEAGSSTWVVEDVLSKDVVQTAEKSIIYSSGALPEKELPARVDENKMLSWDLKDMTKPEPDKDGYYTYTCTIPVTLVNTGENIGAWSSPKEPAEGDDVNGDHIGTNALVDTDGNGEAETPSAKLNCVFVAEASDGAPQLLGTQILRAPSPEVHALYSDGIQLTKKYVMIDKDGKPVTVPKPLAGAQFELTVNSLLDPSSYDEGEIKEIKKAVNDALKAIYADGGDATDTTGLVKTTTLPAGDYTLRESGVGGGYIPSTDAYHFIVSYGKVYHYYFVTAAELNDKTRFTPVDGEDGFYQDANGVKVKAESQDGKYRITNTDPYSFADAPSNNHPMEDWFLNKTQVGALNIVKETKSNFEADRDREFEFRITLTDEEGKLIMGEEREPELPDGDGEGKPDTPPEEGEPQEKEYVSVFNSSSHGAVTFVNGVATVKVSHNHPLSGLSLPHGSHYTVEEIGDPAFIMTAGEELTGKIEYDEKGQTASVVSFTNTRRTGDLEITKIVTPYVDHPRDTQYEFQFTLTIDCDPSVSPPITGICGDLEFVDGVATFTLKHGETVKATGIPAGATYTLEEYGPGYNIVCDNMTGTIVENTGKGEVVKIVVENVEIYVDQPLTGDDSRLGLMLALLAISAAGLAVIAVRRRRSRNNG